MLVLALEFSRGCTAHAWAGHRAGRTNEQRGKPPDRGTHGARGPLPPGQMDRTNNTGRRGAPTGLDSGPTCHGHDGGHHRDRLRQTGRSLKTEE
jgi:hypothetical protein